MRQDKLLKLLYKNTPKGTKATPACIPPDTVRAVDRPVISARVHPQILKRLDKYCEKHKISRQDAIERALSRLLG